MKSIITFLLLVCFNLLSYSQETTQSNNNVALNYLERSAIYDYTETRINNIDTIPDYNSKHNKLKISGTIYESDGITPAKNVILYIEQANDSGDFELKENKGKRYVHHSAWVKTDANGRYTFFTFIPGNDRKFKLLKQLFPIIKAPSEAEYALESFLFEDDPLLTKTCRKRLDKKGDATRILEPKLENDMFVVEKDIILKSSKSNS